MLNIIEVLDLPFLACLPMIAILGYLGIHVLKREVIFIDIALAQIAAVGAIIAHIALGAHDDSILSYVCAFGGTLVAAAFYSVVRRRVEQIPLEAVIGVTYAIATAGTLFIVGVAPGGHMHVQQMLAGSVLWAKWADVAWCAIAFSGVGFCFYLFRKPFTRISDDYARARNEGMRVVLWDFIFYALLGVVITLAVRIAGVVLAFAFLIIPATISALFATRWRTRLVIAWACGAVASLMGLSFSYYLDFSVGPAVALFLGLALILAGLWSLLRARVRAGARGKSGLGLGYPQS
jgi:zinc/manganese transport system permease protein